MLSTTIKAIDQAVQSVGTYTLTPREEFPELAVGAIRRAQGAATPEEARAHTLRAIAYLVRRYELDAPGDG
jgi:hypothetical protein